MKRKTVYMIQPRGAEEWIRTFASEIPRLRKAGHKIKQQVQLPEREGGLTFVWLTIEIS